MTYLFKAEEFFVPRDAKWAFSTRRVDHSDIATLRSLGDDTKAGDLVLCEIVKVNQHKKIQLDNARYSESYPGDTVVVCLGDRYAPDQFMGSAKAEGPFLDLLAGGGLAGRVEAAHASMSAPTQLRAIGMLADKRGQIINIAQYALPRATIPDHVTVLGVFGASMNAGKTTAAVSLAHGLRNAGYRVAGVKATGTGAFGDFNAFADASIPVSDFTDAGFASTFRVPLNEIEQGFETLVGTAAGEGAEIIVVEIADGVFQQETAAILENSDIIRRMDGIMFAAPDALGAVGGIHVLSRHGLCPFAISGKVSLSALGKAEAEADTRIPVITRQELWDPESVVALTDPVMRKLADPIGEAA